MGSVRVDPAAIEGFLKGIQVRPWLNNAAEMIFSFVIYCGLNEVE